MLEKALSAGPETADLQNNLGDGPGREGRPTKRFHTLRRRSRWTPPIGLRTPTWDALTCRTAVLTSHPALRKRLSGTPGSAPELHSQLGFALANNNRSPKVSAFRTGARDLSRSGGGALLSGRGAHDKRPERQAPRNGGRRCGNPGQSPVLNDTAWVLATCAGRRPSHGTEAVTLAEHP